VLKELDGKHNLILNSQSGSGKTLAYLLPVMNSLFRAYDDSSSREGDRKVAGTNKWTMSVENDSMMFQNADELLHRAKRNKDLRTISPMKGAVILSYSKELVNQIYG